jgi:hypothetical protein
MRGLVFGTVLVFAMSGAAAARHGGHGEGDRRGHESEHLQGEHHRHDEQPARSSLLVAKWCMDLRNTDLVGNPIDRASLNMPQSGPSSRWPQTTAQAF